MSERDMSLSCRTLEPLLTDVGGYREGGTATAIPFKRNPKKSLSQ